MGLFGSSEQKKKEKKLHEELKCVRKSMIAAGIDKQKVTAALKSYEENLIYADSLSRSYMSARANIESAIARIDAILNSLGEIAPEEEKQELKTLTGELESVYHDSLIRADDVDYISTEKSLKKLAIEYCRIRGEARDKAQVSMTDKPQDGVIDEPQTGMADNRTKIMLRSELENVRSVLGDAFSWKAPDFMALAYYLRTEDRSRYAQMENEQRNADVAAYYLTNFSYEFESMLADAGQTECMRGIEREYME